MIRRRVARSWACNGALLARQEQSLHQRKGELEGLAGGLPSAWPGRKHKRKIALVSWQQGIVEEHTEWFLRGLITRMAVGR